MALEIENFLNKLSTRLTEIEIAINLYGKIGYFIGSSSRKPLHNNPFVDGAIYQFFTYNQRILIIHFIFNGFISVIGSYDKKNDCLKTWQEFKLTGNDTTLLKAIRKRYSDIRNNLFAHISTTFEPNETHNLSAEQIKEDINNLRDILNAVRKKEGIPPIIQGYDPNKSYQVEGMQYVFEELLRLNELEKKRMEDPS